MILSTYIFIKVLIPNIEQLLYSLIIIIFILYYNISTYLILILVYLIVYI